MDTISTKLQAEVPKRDLQTLSWRHETCDKRAKDAYIKVDTGCAYDYVVLCEAVAEQSVCLEREPNLKVSFLPAGELSANSRPLCLLHLL